MTKRFSARAMPHVGDFRRVGFATLFLSALLVTTPPVAAAAVRHAPTVSTQDRTFLANNAQTDLAEIAAGKLALTRSEAQPVRAAAGTIVTDHTKALAKVRTIAAQLGVTLPATPTPAQLAMATQLKKAASSDFDRLYLQMMAMGHRTAMQLTQTEISNGENPDVIAFAKDYLKTAAAHLGLVNEAIKDTHVTVNEVAPPSGTHVATPTVRKGQFAHGAKTHPSSNKWWLIALLIIVVLALGTLLLWLRRSGNVRRVRG